MLGSWKFDQLFSVFLIDVPFPVLTGESFLDGNNVVSDLWAQFLKPLS